MRSPSAIWPTACAAARRSSQSWPRDERVLTLDERYQMQQLLARRGFNIGEPDGLIGPRTRLAIRDFQVSVGRIPDGFASSAVLDRLRQP